MDDDCGCCLIFNRVLLFTAVFVVIVSIMAMAKTRAVFPCFESTIPLPPPLVDLHILTGRPKSDPAFDDVNNNGTDGLTGFGLTKFNRKPVDSAFLISAVSSPLQTNTIVGFAMSLYDVIISSGPWPCTGVSRPSIWWVSHGSVVIVFCFRRLSRVIIIISID